MRTEHLLRRKADTLEDPLFRPLLNDLQANILKPHGKDESIFAFITFHNDRSDKSIQALKNFLKHLQLTSAREQCEMQDLPLITGFYLSHAGFDYIGNMPPDEEIPAFSEGLLDRTIFGKMNGEADKRYDRTIHAMLMIAGDDLTAINAHLHLMLNSGTDDQILKTMPVPEKQSQRPENLITARIDGIISGFGKAFYEFGWIKKNKSNQPMEWFGFRDGISNPRFFPDPETRHRPDFEEPSRLNSVLRSDRGGAPHSCGSFLVYMKLKQNVEAFERVITNLATKIYTRTKIGDQEKDFAAALLIGRHKDGTPLTRSSVGIPGGKLNRFDYSNDPEGSACPLHAHIRKVNPRNGTDYSRIVRRGMVYGNEYAPEKGLLFLSFQRDLELQFESTVKRMFRESYNFNTTGRDPLISSASKYRTYYKTWGGGTDTKKVSTLMEDLITFKGGLYFYAPSRSYINNNLGMNL